MGRGLFTLDNVDTRMLYKEFQDGVEVYNDTTWGLVAKFVRNTTKESVKVWERDMEFVESVEGFLETWQKIHSREVSLPLKDFALGFGFTKQAIQDSTADELRETQTAALRAHLRLLAKRFFYRVMTPGSGTASRGFWDGLMGAAGQRAPPTYKNNSFVNTHNHYLASGAATPTLANLNQIRRHIREHGYAGELFLFINSNVVEDFETLTAFTTTMTPVDIINQVAKEGFSLVKRFQGFSMVTEDWVPDGYLVALEADVKPVTMREPLQPAGRGLKLYEGPYSDMPLREAYYESRFDLDVVHRGAGVVMKLTSGSFTAPTFDFT